MSVQSKVQFLKWVESRDPFLYRVANKTRELKSAGYMGLGASDKWYDSLIGTIKSIVPVVVKAKAQRKALSIQMRRAEKGLPPLNISQYTPAIRISPEITPESEAALTRMAKSTLKSSVKQVAMFAIPAAIGLFYMLRKK